MPKYVNSKAKLKCSMGSGQSVLGASPPAHSVSLQGGPMATVMDHKPVINIKPFGTCGSLGNPSVAAATAANYGRLQRMPCVPNTPAPWINGKINVLVNGKPALTDACKCLCVWGGAIRVAGAGQKAVSDGA